jgi:glutathione synthase/RimK-type ligase-like ATP-grasp enzyme
MDRYDLCLACNWEHDTDFAAMLAAACRARGLLLLQITPENVVEAADDVAKDRIAFQAFWDRTSEGDARFVPIVQWAADHGVCQINPPEQARLTWDKGQMHSALVGLGLHTPYTIILPSYEEEPALAASIDLKVLGERFIIKPAHGGGGEGVIVEATLLSQVLSARQEYPSDRYLLQAHVTPIQLGEQAAWFRVIYSAGKVYICWWDTNTHVYTSVTAAEETSYHLSPLRTITTSIADFCGLDLFSTEVALTPNDLFVVVDYVNDQIDLRLQSKAADGVPDTIVLDIADGLVGLVAARCSAPYTDGVS